MTSKKVEQRQKYTMIITVEPLTEFQADMYWKSLNDIADKFTSFVKSKNSRLNYKAEVIVKDL